MRCTVLQCIAVHCSVCLQCNEDFTAREGAGVCVAVCCCALQYVAVCCSVVAVCCSVLQCVLVMRSSLPEGAQVCVLQCVAVCCRAVQCVAVCVAE